MAKRLETETGQANNGMSNWISELRDTEVLVFPRFSVRRLQKTQGEWDLGCLALNEKRLCGVFW